MMTDDAQMDLNSLRTPQEPEKSEAQRQVIDMSACAFALEL